MKIAKAERIGRLIAAMDAEPGVEFSSARAAKIMDVTRSTLAIYIKPALDARMLFKRAARACGKDVFYSRTPYDIESAQPPADPYLAMPRTLTSYGSRHSTATGWQPPRMQCTRSSP